MKKVVVFLAVASLAAVASAGTVTWAAEVLKDGSPMAGGIAYLFVGDSTAGVADAITGGTFNPSSALASATTDSDGEISQKGIGTYTSTTVNLYMVVFDTNPYTDDSNFVVSGVVSQTFGASGNKTFNFSSSLSSATWTPVKESTPDPGPDDPDPSIVPEPTTVALLALGLAAFGLKRKIA